MKSSNYPQHDIMKHIVVHIGTAHPLKSPDGKTMYYYGTNMNYKQAYNFVKIPISNDKESKILFVNCIFYIEVSLFH